MWNDLFAETKGAEDFTENIFYLYPPDETIERAGCQAQLFRRVLGILLSERLADIVARETMKLRRRASAECDPECQDR